jgi:signal transduction histidine kinase
MRWFFRRPEYVISAAALALLGVLIPWWVVFARRLVAQNFDLQQRLHAARFEGTVDLAAEANRLNTMLVSEFATIAMALVLAIAALAYIARDRRAAQQRMERLLQFTSHELKTPIAGVRALLQSLSMGSVPESAKVEFLQRGLLEIDRLDHLTETILAWQRSMAAVDHVRLVGQSAQSLVQSVLEHRRATGALEELSVESMTDVRVLADADAFRVILENLLDNVRKYGGARARLSAAVADGHWQLQVIDAGMGFPPDEAERLFDPFRRQARDGITHGSGLGLYLSRELAGRMNAKLSAASAGPGCGSVFTMTLPLAEVGSG